MPYHHTPLYPLPPLPGFCFWSCLSPGLGPVWIGFSCTLPCGCSKPWLVFFFFFFFFFFSLGFSGLCHPTTFTIILFSIQLSSPRPGSLLLFFWIWFLSGLLLVVCCLCLTLLGCLASGSVAWLFHVCWALPATMPFFTCHPCKFCIAMHHLHGSCPVFLPHHSPGPFPMPSLPITVPTTTSILLRLPFSASPFSHLLHCGLYAMVATPSLFSLVWHGTGSTFPLLVCLCYSLPLVLVLYEPAVLLYSLPHCLGQDPCPAILPMCIVSPSPSLNISHYSVISFHTCHLSLCLNLYILQPLLSFSTTTIMSSSVILAVLCNLIFSGFFLDSMPAWLFLFRSATGSALPATVLVRPAAAVCLTCLTLRYYERRFGMPVTGSSPSACSCYPILTILPSKPFWCGLCCAFNILLPPHHLFSCHTAPLCAPFLLPASHLILPTCTLHLNWAGCSWFCFHMLFCLLSVPGHSSPIHAATYSLCHFSAVLILSPSH